MKIEEYITEHREQMDIQTPENGHLDRFEALLLTDERCHPQRKHRLMWSICSGAVAAAIAVPLLYLALLQPTTSVPADESVAEVTDFYRTQLTEEISKVEKILPHLDTTARQEVIKTLRATQDSLRFLSEIPTDLSTEEKITIVAVNYGNTITVIRNTGKIFEEISKNN